MSGFTAVGLFLISIFFSIFIFSLWLRIALRYLRISALNPLSQLVHTITNPMVNPIQKLLKKPLPSQKYEVATLITLVLVEICKISVLSFLAFGRIIPFGYFLAYLIADLIIQPCDMLFYAILIRLIMSFVNPQWTGPIATFLYVLTEPLFQLGRKIIPNISGFDFGPFIMLIILKIISLFVSANLPGNLF